MRSLVRLLQFGLALGAAVALMGFTPETHQLTLAVQATGTVKWELAAMSALGLDKKNKLELTINDVADSPAGQIALQAHSADVSLSDFVWVSLQRHQGNMVTMVPHSLTVGGLMVDPAAGIATLGDLKGKALAVSGSPVDKSFVILSADYNKLTGGNLSDDATIKFGAPPLVNEIFTGGQAQAALNLWNWNARAKIAGKTQLISVGDMLADLGVSQTPPLLGWTFFEDFAKAHKDSVKAFLNASFATKAALLTDDAVWDEIRDVMNVGDDDALFQQLRDDYRAGIVQRYNPSDMGPAAESFAVMAKFGGPDVVGDATDLADGTFYKGYRK
jgi:NitT/TauT family transport system substrate-binding protein